MALVFSTTSYVNHLLAQQKAQSTVVDLSSALRAISSQRQKVNVSSKVQISDDARKLNDAYNGQKEASSKVNSNYAAITESKDVLGRMRYLASMSIEQNYSEKDREAVNEEFTKLSQQLQSTLSTEGFHNASKGEEIKVSNHTIGIVEPPPPKGRGFLFHWKQP